MTFARPFLLLVAPSLALLLALAVVAYWRRVERLRRAYGESVARRLLPAHVDRFPVGRMVCLVLAAAAIGVAAAGPSPIAPSEPVAPPDLDLAVVVDVSLSMSATDAEPSRLERARDAVTFLADELPGARLVLDVYADWPYTLVPPTDDPGVVTYFARSLATDLVLDRDQGSSLATAILHARAALDSRPRAGAERAIVVVSDGGRTESDEEIIDAVRTASADGVRVYAAGLGTDRGSELVSDGGPVLDDQGRPVVVPLDDGILRAIAEAGGGVYESVNDEGGLRDLLDRVRREGGQSASGGSQPIDPVFWLSLLAIGLVLAEGALDAGRGRSLWQQLRGDAA